MQSATWTVCAATDCTTELRILIFISHALTYAGAISQTNSLANTGHTCMTFLTNNRFNKGTWLLQETKFDSLQNLIHHLLGMWCQQFGVRF